MHKYLLIAAVSATTSFFSTSTFAADAANGEALFKKCSSCHTIGDGAENGVGPGLVWTEEELSAWLVNPKKYLRAKLEDKKAKSKMSFKLKKEEERADVIAYLATFSEPAE